jgi:hypothetical protein
MEIIGPLKKCIHLSIDESNIKIITKYTNGFHSLIKKEVVMFEVKTLNETCKKAMYIETKYHKKSIDVSSTYEMDA